MRLKRAFIIGLSLALERLALQALAQEDKAKGTKKEEPYTLQVDVDLVNLAVAVAGPSGNFLTDLKKEQLQQFTKTRSSRRLPISLP